MLAFLNTTTYYFGFLILLVSSFIIIKFKKDILFTYRLQISIFFALFQLFIFIMNMIFFFSHGYWWATLIHDLCPMVSFSSIIIFFLNKDVLYKAIMPWLLIGSTVTILTGSAEFYREPWDFITFFEHLTMFCQGVVTYIWISKYDKTEYLLVLILPIFLIVWNCLTAYLPWKITNNEFWADSSTGMFLPSLAPGKNFEVLGTILPIPYPLPTIIFYGLSLGVCYLICLNKKYFVIYWNKLIKKNN